MINPKLKDVFEELKKYNIYCDLDESYINTINLNNNITQKDVQNNSKYNSSLAYIFSKINVEEIMESIEYEGCSLVSYGIFLIPKIFTKI